MCTPVYVTIKTATAMAPVVSYVFGAILFAIGSVICFAKALKPKRVTT